jgi:hypothetical protein
MFYFSRVPNLNLDGVYLSLQQNDTFLSAAAGYRRSPTAQMSALAPRQRHKGAIQRQPG